jgi:hypothetical protein
MPSSSWSSSISLGPVSSEDENITITRTVGSSLPSRHSVTSQKVWIFGITLCYPQILQTKACPSGPGSAVDIATALQAGRSGDRISVGGEIFRTCPDRPWGPPSLLYNGYRVFTGGKVRPGRDAEPSPPSSAEVKNRVELYLYSS